MVYQLQESLINASATGRADVVEQLLSTTGMDVNRKHHAYRYTALRVATERGHTAIVEMLLAVPGIDVSKASNRGSMALTWAIQKGHTAITKLLTDASDPYLVKKNKEARLPRLHVFLLKLYRDDESAKCKGLVDLWLINHRLQDWMTNKEDKNRAKRLRVN